MVIASDFRLGPIRKGKEETNCLDRCRFVKRALRQSAELLELRISIDLRAMREGLRAKEKIAEKKRKTSDSDGPEEPENSAP